jgi:uncharacterized membrane protein YfcA
VLYLLLLLIGAVAYIISTLSGGGGALILLPILGFYFPTPSLAPVINLGNMIGRPARLILFWKHIEWKVVYYYVPSAILGALVGGLVFIQIEASWLQLLLGCFLISTIFQFRFGKKRISFKLSYWHFIPLGLVVSFLSTLFGATGAIMNPFYLNMGMLKEKMIATKTANSFLAGVAQIGTYTFLGALYGKLWIYGIVIGIGALIGNVIGKKLLAKMSDQLFLKMVLLIMLLSGIIMIVRAIPAIV